MFCYVKKTPEVCPVLGENVTCANRSPILVFRCLTQNERKKLRKKRTLQKRKKDRQEQKDRKGNKWKKQHREGKAKTRHFDCSTHILTVLSLQAPMILVAHIFTWLSAVGRGVKPIGAATLFIPAPSAADSTVETTQVMAVLAPCTWRSDYRNYRDGDLAQLVHSPTSTPLMPVWFSGVARDFEMRKSTERLRVNTKCVW